MGILVSPLPLEKLSCSSKISRVKIQIQGCLSPSHPPKHAPMQHLSISLFFNMVCLHVTRKIYKQDLDSVRFLYLSHGRMGCPSSTNIYFSLTILNGCLILKVLHLPYLLISRPVNKIIMNICLAQFSQFCRGILSSISWNRDRAVISPCSQHAWPSPYLHFPFFILYTLYHLPQEFLI